MLADEQPAPTGHNRPPSPVEHLADEQREALTTFAQRRDEIVASASAKNVFDRASAGDAGDIIRIARDVFERIDQDRRERTDPYRRAAEAAKGAVDEFWQPVLNALDGLRSRLKQWTDAEDARIAAQQAEQDAEMERLRQQRLPMSPMPHASAQPTTPARMVPAPSRKIRGDLGATVSTVEKPKFEVVDVKLVPDWIMATPTVHRAIIQVVESMAKHAGEIPGIARSTVSTNQIR